MSIKLYVSDRIVCGSGDSKPTHMEDGAHLIETGANGLIREYVKTDGLWRKIFPVSGDVKVVDTISNLKALAVDDYTSAYVRGYHSTDDGGGGLFYRTTDTTNTNSGSLILSNSAGYAWKRTKNSRDYYAEEWGAKGDGSTDDAPAIQNLVDYLISGDGGKARFQAGKTYALQSPIILAELSAGSYNQVGGISFEADTHHPSLSAFSTELHQKNGNLPCVIIQHGRNIQFKGIGFRGMNTFFTEDKVDETENLLDTNNYLSSNNSVSTGRYNPHAGLVTDPFSSSSTLVGANSGNQYPNLSNYYTGTAGGTATLSLENCNFYDLVVGFLQNPNPLSTIQQGDGFSLYDCKFQYCREGIVACQSQSRAVNLFNCGFSFCDTHISTKTYGRQAGAPPKLFGGQLGNCRRLFDIEPSFGPFEVYGIHSEVVHSIGIIGSAQDGNSSPVLFDACRFTFATTTGRRSEHAGFFAAPINFRNCSFSSTNSGTLNFVNGYETNALSPVRFENCRFLSASRLYADQTFTLTSYRNAKFENCGIFDSTILNNGAQLRDHDISPDTEDYNRNFVPYGGFLTIGENTYTTDFLQEEIGVGSISNITFDTGAGTATGSISSALNAALLRTGDNVINRQSFNIFDPDGNGTVANVIGQYVGIITIISGTSLFLRDVPKCWNNSHSLTSNTVKRLRRYHQPTTGDITNGSNLINNVAQTSAWKTGDSIRHGAFPIGTYITKITGNVITTSRNSTQTLTSGSFYDVKYVPITTGGPYYPIDGNPSGYLTSGDSTFVKQTQYILTGANNSGTLDWNNKFLKHGDTSVIDWGNQFLTDQNGFGAANWNSRILTDSSENTTLNWQNKYFTGTWYADTIRTSGSSLATAMLLHNTGATLDSKINSHSGYWSSNPSGFLKVIREDRTLPTVFNGFIDIGNFLVTNGAHNIKMSVTISNTSISLSKQYTISTEHNHTTGFWQTLYPISTTGPYFNREFDVDINGSGSNLHLRLRRIGSIVSTTGTAKVTLLQLGIESDNFTSSTNTGIAEGFYATSGLINLTPFAVTGDYAPLTSINVLSGHIENFYVNRLNTQSITGQKTFTSNLNIVANFSISGGNPWALKTRRIIQTYTPTWGDDVILCTVQTGYAVTLPNANTVSGKLFRFKRVTAANGLPLVISGAYIDGETGINLPSGYNSLTVVSDGSGYYTF